MHGRKGWTVVLALGLILGIGSWVLAQIPNDLCADAIGPLAVDSVTTGTTTGASADLAPGNCGTPITSSGVWYTTTGTGNTMTASTCNDGNPDTGSADYDTKISIFCSGCGIQTCIAGQDDNFGAGCAGFSTYLEWASVAGAEYLIYVHGFNEATGDFELAILDDGEPVPAAIACEAAVPSLPAGPLALLAALLIAVSLWKLAIGNRTVGPTAAASIALLALLLAPTLALADGVSREVAGETYYVEKYTDTHYTIEDAAREEVGTVAPEGETFEAFDTEGTSLGTAESLEDAIALIHESLLDE